jgi:uncharacterized protein YbjT (DUF2867 family)
MPRYYDNRYGLNPSGNDGIASTSGKKMACMNSKPVLVTGATGYVGGRLVPLLLKSGYRVRVMGRSLAKLGCRPWAAHPNTELVQADMMDPASTEKAASGCGAAFYLVHSMNARGRDFAEADRKASGNMVRAAAAAGLDRIIYLGGLGGDDPEASEHLRSRAEVAKILRSGPVPATFLRAAVILGSGSVSFEMMRYLVDRLPVMITPRWVHTPCQPIAVTNVLHYLKGCLENEETAGRTFDIGGPDIVTYGRLMRIYAEEAALPKRLIIPVPGLTPRLSSYWVHLVTPVPSSIATPLIKGLKNPVICRENSIRRIVPQKLISCREAIRLALQKIQQQAVETCWSDAGGLKVPEWINCGDTPYSGGTVFECGYRVILKAAPDDVWRPIQRIGGGTGWYYADLLWALRGAADRLMGGIGHSRGRRNPRAIYVGDALDFWRVLQVDAPRRLQLLAEIRLPGEAILDFQVHPLPDGKTELQQLARFLPRGLFGLLYWYALYPVHQWIYRGMLRRIAEKAKGAIVEGPDRFAPRMARVCHMPTSR